MKKLLVLWGFVLMGCGVSKMQLSGSEKVYTDKVMSHPTTFTLPKTIAQDAWARANLFVAQHSDMKIQNATEFLIDTYNVTEVGSFGYTFTRTPVGDSVMFIVKCNHALAVKTSINDMMYHLIDRADFNEHVASYYMTTGQLMAELIGKYWADKQ